MGIQFGRIAAIASRGRGGAFSKTDSAGGQQYDWDRPDTDLHAEASR